MEDYWTINMFGEEKEKLNCNLLILKNRGVKDIKFFTVPKSENQTDDEYKLSLMKDINDCLEAVNSKRYKEISGIGDSLRNKDKDSE